MIGRIATYTLRHRAIVVALLVLFLIAGINAFLRLPVEAFPDVSNMSVQVITLFPGHAAEEVERLVTIPIENQMNSVPKLVAAFQILTSSRHAGFLRTEFDSALSWDRSKSH